MENLKNCPFCGKIPSIQTFEQDNNDSYFENYFCIKCGCGITELVGYEKNKEKLIKKWNTRHENS